MTTFLPNVLWPTDTPVTPQTTINEVARSPASTQAQCAGAWAAARILYGTDRIGADVWDIGTVGNNLVMWLLWGYGPWDGLVSFTVDDKALSGGTVKHYDGTQTAADPTLAAMYGATGDAYKMGLMVYPNLVYSVLTIPMTQTLPQCAAVWRGRKLYNPVTGLWAHSNNPSLALADFLASPVYGCAENVRWASVPACLNRNDAMIGDRKRSVLNLTLADRKFTANYVDVLRDYAEVILYRDGDEIVFVPDAPATPVIQFDESNILAMDPIKFRDSSDAGNVVQVTWTDTSQIPYREQYVEAVTPGIDARSAQAKLTKLSMPGFRSASQAMRYAIGYLNKSRLADMSTTITVPDIGISVLPGQVIGITHSVGLNQRAFRVATRQAPALGDFRFPVTEYDEACYSDAIVDESWTPDTNLPDPAHPPAPTGLVLTEEVFQLRTGTYSSRIAATWTKPDWAFIVGFRVEVREGLALIDGGTTVVPEFRTGALQEGRTYTVSVTMLARGGAESPAAQSSLQAQGKQLPPGPIPAGSFKGFEAGGTVFLSWGQAVDIDIWRYRVRRGKTTDSYAQAKDIDLVDALRYTDVTAPPGTWRYWVESVDSVRKESGMPRSLDIEVTTDINAFLNDTAEQVSPTLSNMMEFRNSPEDAVRRFVTNDGRSWESVFSGAMNGYTDPLLSYFATVPSSWTGEAEDFGLELSGAWRGTATVSALSGSATSELQLATEAAPSTWLPQGSLSVRAKARFARMQHAASAGSSMLVEIPTQEIRIDAVPREESVAFTSSSSGPVTVTLTNEFTKYLSARIEVDGASALIGMTDNLQTGAPSTIDCSVVDLTNQRVATTARLLVKGV